MKTLSDLKIKIFADGADKQSLLSLYANPLIKGVTTNPTLMRKANVADYAAFAQEVLGEITEKPISFEVFSDEFPEMRRQALKLSALQNNVYVKIPVTNTRRESCAPLIAELAAEGVKLNVTALLTVEQVREVAGALNPLVPSVVSVFAGRIADTGRDPSACMQECLYELKNLTGAELLWASCREVLNIFQADECGAHIITVPPDILKKALAMWACDLADLSLETVKMFHRDAREAGYTL